mmetsp:Transcript_10581/g.48106  ORF Transcript_10581/g.48106 Transcript_10581/m.48106 type:complete len:213 (-) Transcript_10581:2022-2660(-)
MDRGEMVRVGGIHPRTRRRRRVRVQRRRTTPGDPRGHPRDPSRVVRRRIHRGRRRALPRGHRALLRALPRPRRGKRGGHQRRRGRGVQHRVLVREVRIHRSVRQGIGNRSGVGDDGGVAVRAGRPRASPHRHGRRDTHGSVRREVLHHDGDQLRQRSAAHGTRVRSDISGLRRSIPPSVRPPRAVPYWQRRARAEDRGGGGDGRCDADRAVR